MLRTKPSNKVQSASSLSDEETLKLYPTVTPAEVEGPGTLSERLVLESSDWTAPPIVFTSTVNAWAMVAGVVTVSHSGDVTRAVYGQWFVGWLWRAGHLSIVVLVRGGGCMGLSETRMLEMLKIGERIAWPGSWHCVGMSSCIIETF